MVCTYTAEFRWDGEYGGWTAEFPAWRKAVIGFTCGRTWEDVVYMAHDLLGTMCVYREDEREPFPVQERMEIPSDAVVRDITADTDEFRRFFKRTAKGRFRFRLHKKLWEKYTYDKKLDLTESEEKLQKRKRK